MYHVVRNILRIILQLVVYYVLCITNWILSIYLLVFLWNEIFGARFPKTDNYVPSTPQEWRFVELQTGALGFGLSLLSVIILSPLLWKLSQIITNLLIRLTSFLTRYIVSRITSPVAS